jgi:hypothetical protein
LPRVGALDQLRGANGDGVIDRARSNPWLVVAIAAGAILLLAWVGWAIYVTSKNGAGAGLGVVIAWPAMLAGVTLVSLPFVGGYLLVKRLSDGEGSTADAGSPADEREEPEDSAEDENPAEEEGQDEEADDDHGDEEESEPEASRAG